MQCFIRCFATDTSLAYTNRTIGEQLVDVWLDAFEYDEVGKGGCPKLVSGTGGYIDRSNMTCTI